MTVNVDVARASSVVDRLLRSSWTPVALIAVGVALRLFWWMAVAHAPAHMSGEASNVARAIATTGSIADAFRPGQGPTAHLMPLTPLLAGGVYRIFGIETSAANFILTCVSLFLVFASFWLFDATFGRLGVPLLARRIALAILCILPFNFSLEVVTFRVWEGALAVAFASGFLFLVVKWDGRTPEWLEITCLCALLFLLLFVQPNFGVAAVAIMALYAWRNIPPRRYGRLLLTMLAAGFVVFAPWVARNELVMNSPIVLRDNLGLEMALAFYDGAEAPANPRDAFFDRLEAIHPFQGDAGYRAMQEAGGEVAYAKLLQSQTLAWIGSHPVTSVKLAIRHWLEIYFPPAWLWSVYGDSASALVPRLFLIWSLSCLGILGCVTLALGRDHRALYPAILLFVTTLPFALVQPVLRYRYLIFALLIYYASDAVVRGSRALFQASGRVARPAPSSATD